MLVCTQNAISRVHLSFPCVGLQVDPGVVPELADDRLPRAGNSMLWQLHSALFLFYFSFFFFKPCRHIWKKAEDNVSFHRYIAKALLVCLLCNWCSSAWGSEQRQGSKGEAQTILKDPTEGKRKGKPSLKSLEILSATLSSFPESPN